jgi:hypothetical protein
MRIPSTQTDISKPAAEQAGYGSDRLPAIPRISHDQRHTAASGGIWLHSPDMRQGRLSVPELVF